MRDMAKTASVYGPSSLFLSLLGPHVFPASLAARHKHRTEFSPIEYVLTPGLGLRH